MACSFRFSLHTILSQIPSPIFCLFFKTPTFFSSLQPNQHLIISGNNNSRSAFSSFPLLNSFAKDGILGHNNRRGSLLKHFVSSQQEPQPYQFFALKKKRKTLSPTSKFGKLEKEARNQIEGSPSAKVPLENYLALKPDGDSTAKSLNTANDQKTNQVPVKKNRTVDCGPSFRDEHVESLSLTQGQYQNQAVTGSSQRLKSEPLYVTDSVTTECLPKDSSDFVMENSELKEFATGFLSLYCSELPSNVSLQSETKLTTNKRHNNSPTLELEEKLSKRRHCGSDGNQFYLKNEFTSSPKVILSKIVIESGETDSECLRKAIVRDNPFQSQASLRKCSHSSTPCTGGCGTSGSFIAKLGARKTPQSTRGGSLFSPGEAFWSEAITVADGLNAPNYGLSTHVAEYSEAQMVDYDICNSNIVENGGCRILNMALDRVLHAVCDAGDGSAFVSKGKNGKDMDKEALPLPVKHFDFYFEGKNVDEETPSHSNTNKPGISMSKENTLASISHHGTQSSNLMCIGRKDQTNGNMPNVEGTSSKCAILERNLNHLTQHSNNTTGDTPDKEYSRIVTNHESKSDFTPASFSSNKDILGLSYWLPLDICNIYKKKGISKLYPWQVECLQVDGVLHNGNLVYCASTSAGKSFVAEILMLRRVLSAGKIALLVLPYVSICAEKAEHLEILLEPVHKHVRSYYGNQGGGTLPKDTSVAVCTIEKAKSLIYKLLEEGRLSELGTIVIDELHMVTTFGANILFQSKRM